MRPYVEYASHVWGGSTHAQLLNRVDSKAFRLIDSPPSTDCLQPLSCRILLLWLSLITFFTLTALLNLVTACLPLSCGPTAEDLRLSTQSHPYTVHLPYAIVNEYRHSLII